MRRTTISLALAAAWATAWAAAMPAHAQTVAVPTGPASTAPAPPVPAPGHASPLAATPLAATPLAATPLAATPLAATSLAATSLTGVTLAAESSGPGAGLLSENDFLSEIPRVFSASRLPQAPSDSPVAVTVIDRDMIRATGARDVAELFGLVPGFVTGFASGGRPVVAYHGLSGQISQRMQVLLDGRSLYAPYLFGGVDWNTLPISLDDIDRIEVLRGSNSATYGANAFLGVANIVTRTASQSAGGHASVLAGGNGIRDVHARYGGGGQGLSWRVSAGEKRDEGLAGVFDPRRSRYFGVRGEWQLTNVDEVSFAAGRNENTLGLGRRGSAGDPERYERTSTDFAQVRWRRTFSADHEMSLSASRTIDSGSDKYLIGLTPADGLLVDYGRRAERWHVEYQHWLGVSDALRASWGAEFRSDGVVARQLFNTDAAQRSHTSRVFVNAEWTPSPRWTLNAGGTLESDALSGTHFAPRLVANWKYRPDQTLRFGVSEAFRTPSLFEQRSDWRFVFAGQTIDIRYLSRGGLRPERVRAAEVTWLAEFRDAGLSIDARAFDERVTGLITQQLYSLPPGTEFDPNSGAYDLRNADTATIRGLEYQLRWRPVSWQTWTFGHYLARRSGSEAFVTESIPTYGAHLLGTFRMADDRSFSLLYRVAAPIRWIGESTTTPASRRLDLRLEQGFQAGGLRGSVALVGQALGGDIVEFRANQSFGRRGWLVLTVEY